MNLGNLDFKIGGINPSGIGATIYRIAKKDILAWPSIGNDPDASTGTVDSLSKYSGNFTLAEDAVWDKLYSTQGKGKATFEVTGEVDCKMYTNKASLSFPDLTAEALAFCKAAANGDFVFIVKAAGRFHVIGSPDYRATISPTGDTGDAAGSAKGVSFEVECPDVTPLPLYVGELTLSDGTLDCSDGSFTPAS
jgi:hypothetical protein